MIATLVLLGLTVVGFLVLLDRRDKRAHETALAHRLEQAGMVGRLETLVRDHAAFVADCQREHRLEVATLCQRIQAPEYAVVEHQQAQHGDEDPYPLTDRETAEAQEQRAAAIAEIERMEREGILS